jgi:hypothetical protein
MEEEESQTNGMSTEHLCEEENRKRIEPTLENRFVYCDSCIGDQLEHQRN